MGQVNGAAVIPEKEVVILPVMAIDKLWLCAVSEKEFEQFAAFCLREIDDAGGETFVHKKRFSPGFRMRAYHRMHDLSHLVLLLLGEFRTEFRSTEFGVAVAV